MKKAEEYIKDIPTFTDTGGYGKEYVIEAIKQAQLDAIEETVKLCSETADITMKKKSHYGKYRKWQKVKEDEVDLFNYEVMYSVDKQSILNCAEILKKELE